MNYIKITSILRREQDEFDLIELENLIIEKKPKAFYLVATNHNPTCENLSLKQRNALYNLALKYKFYIIVDDVYESLYFEEEKRLPPLFYCSDETLNNYSNNKLNDLLKHDNNSNPYIISLHSFNKIWVPGWRLVYLN